MWNNRKSSFGTFFDFLKDESRGTSIIQAKSQRVASVASIASMRYSKEQTQHELSAIMMEIHPHLPMMRSPRLLQFVTIVRFSVMNVIVQEDIVLSSPDSGIDVHCSEPSPSFIDHSRLWAHQNCNIMFCFHCSCFNFTGSDTPLLDKMKNAYT